MEEKKIKKKKLTLTVSSNKPYNIPHYRSSKQKTSVVIEKKISRKKNERRCHDQDKSVSKSAPGFINKTKSYVSGERKVRRYFIENEVLNAKQLETPF